MDPRVARSSDFPLGGALAFLFLASSSLVGVIVYLGQDLTIWLLFCVLLASFLAAMHSQLRITDPLFWLPSGIALYYFSAPILHYFGYLELRHLEAVIFHGAVAIISAILGLLAVKIFPSRLDKGFSYFRHSDRSNFSVLIALSLLFIFIVLTAWNNWQFIVSGAETKRDFARDPDHRIFHFVFNWMLVFYLYSLAVLLGSRKRFPFFLVFLMLFITFFTAINTGERDVFFKFVVATTFLFFGVGVLKNRTVWMVLAVALFLVPVLHEMKTIIHRNEFSFDLDSLWIKFLSVEFSSGGLNFDRLLLASHLYEKNGLEFLINDLIRGVAPGLIYEVQNTGTWFNSSYAKEALGRDRPGMGFSLLGASYIYGGLVGVIIIHFLVGVLAAVLFRLSAKGAGWLVAYSIGAPFLVYSLRGDLAYIISGLLKQIWIPLLIIYIGKNFCEDLSRAASWGRKKFL